MTSIKLSKDVKTTIENKIISKSKVQKALAKAKEGEVSVGLAIRDFTLGKHKDAYLSLPKSWVNNRGYISIANVPPELGSAYTYIHLSESIKGINESVHCPKTTVLYTELEDNIKKKVDAYLKKLIKAEEEYSKYNLEVRRLLGGINTTKQFFEVFPDREDLLPDYVLEKVRGNNLPAVSAETINLIKNGLEK